MIERSSTLSALLRIGAALLALLLQTPAPALSQRRTGTDAPPAQESPTRGAEVSTAVEWVDVERVVDGDTLHVRRGRAIEKLRLMSVDTEERLGPGHPASATKPQTVFGEESALWAKRLFDGLARDGALPRVGLLLPHGLEKKDVYGRLLCHVLLPDGTDYNLMLVRTGRSPYFNKYGNDPIDHAAFVAAQRAAREERLGIWDPATNAPATPGAPAARRPYPELIAWWNARARAVEDWSGRAAAEPGKVADCDDPEDLESAATAGAEVEVFGEVDRIFEESSGDRTVLLRASDGERALRITVPAALREAHERLDLDGLAREFRQNYVWVRGRVERGARGFRMRSQGPERWRRAGPEPSLPPPARPR